MRKVAIVDDEAAGRTLIREYLAAHPALVVVAEANNGVDAVRLINEFKPDLIFLDVQMPGLDGFQVLTHLDEIPAVIFSTAYDGYALRAFEVHAVDYLLKPYIRVRFDQAVLRALGALDQPNAVAPLAESLLRGEQTYPAKILVPQGRTLKALAVADIVRIQAAGDYAQLTTPEATYLSNYGIGVLEERLDPRHFLRVHRSTIVGLGYIAEVEKYGNGYSIRLTDGERVQVSRGYAESVKKLIF